LERGKKIFGKVRFFFNILARLVRFFAAIAGSSKLGKNDKKSQKTSKNVSLFEQKAEKMKKK